MAIVKMKRLQILALERDHDAMLRRLQHMGCVEISEPETETLPDSLKRCQDTAADCMAQQRQVQAAMDALRRLSPKAGGGGLLIPRPQITEQDYLNEDDFAAQLRDAEAINDLTAELNRLTAQETQLRAQQTALLPWQTLDIPTELTSTRRVDITTGVLPPFANWDEVQGQLAQQVPETALYQLSVTREQQCVLLLSHQAVTAQALELLRQYGFSSGQLKGRTGTVQQQLDGLVLQLDQTAAEKQAVLQNIDLLTDAGIEAEDFGGSTVVVRAVPADVPVDDVEDMIVEVAAKLIDGGRDALREKTENALLELYGEIEDLENKLK